MSDTILPWQNDQWLRLVELISQEKLPHGLLLAGQSFIGKSTFAGRLATLLLCKTPSGQPCGECDRCLLMAAGTHPDYHLVTLEDSKQIKVDQIRDLIGWAQQTSQQGGRKVCVINPADAMNQQSANALLKCLEEPVANTYLLLLTDQATRLLPTIRSRCQRIDFHLPPKHMAVNWLTNQLDEGTDVELLLEIASGVPLKVVAQFDEDFLNVRETLVSMLLPVASGKDSPLVAAAKLAKSDPLDVLEIMFQLVTDSLRHSVSTGKIPFKNSDIQSVLKQYGDLVSTAKRYALLDRIVQARGTLLGTSNANAQMLLEWVLLKTSPQE